MEEQKQLSLTDLHASFEYNRKALTQAVTKLEKEAQNIHDQLETKKASQARIAAAQREIASLKGTKSDLFLEFQKAEFDDSTEAKKELKNKRRQIDERIAELDEAIREEREALPTLYPMHVAETAVQIDMLKPLKIADFMEQLEAMLDEQAKELNGRIKAMKIPSSAYSRKDYDSFRAGRDSGYATQLAQHKRLAAKEAEKRKKMRDISNTSDMADAMGSRRRLEDRLNVTSKAKKVQGYSERRVSTDEQGDPTHVLSGDEVRKILAEKQAKKAS